MFMVVFICSNAVFVATLPVFHYLLLFWKCPCTRACACGSALKDVCTCKHIQNAHSCMETHVVTFTSEILHNEIHVFIFRCACAHMDVHACISMFTCAHTHLLWLTACTCASRTHVHNHWWHSLAHVKLCMFKYACSLMNFHLCMLTFHVPLCRFTFACTCTCTLLYACVCVHVFSSTYEARLFTHKGALEGLKWSNCHFWISY